MSEKPESSEHRVSQQGGGVKPPTPSRVSWHSAGIADHFVQFYREDSILVDSVADFMGSGLRQVEGAIVMCTGEHLRAIEERLEASMIHLPGARARRQYVPLDAAETLARIMVNGIPDEALFRDVVGSTVTEMLSSGYRVRAFGELVALLWAERKFEAAIQIEQFWNNLGKKVRFALLCAYPMAHFERGSDDEGFKSICAAHSSFISA